MRNLLAAVLMVSLGANTVLADVKVVRTIQMDSVMGFGGGPKTQTLWTAADRQRDEQKGEGKPSMLEKMAGAGRPTIVRLDKKVRWTLNVPKKTYEETSLVLPKTEKDDSKPDSDKRDSNSPEEKPTTKITKAEFKVTPLNQKKKIGAYDCEGYSVRTLLEMEDLESHERSEMKMISTLWNTAETGAVAQLKNEEQAYAKAYWTALGLDASAQESFKMMGTAMFASMAGSGDSELSKALKGMPEELKKAKGYPISIRVEMYGKADDSASTETTSEEDSTEIPTSVGDALGSFAGAFAKKKMEAKKPAKNSEGQIMFAVTTTIQSIETSKIPADTFEVPAGYKPVHH